MIFTRRDVIASAAAGGRCCAGSAPVCARGGFFWPKPIQFIIPYAAGGGFDAYVRFVAPR